MEKHGKGDERSSGILDDLLDGPPVVTLETANRALLLGRSAGFDLAKRGVYPCPVFRAGNGYRVATIELCALLGFTYPRSAASNEGPSPQARAA